ncbi:MAG: cell division protein ZapA [Deltaproteobacteria bacterium]|nr:cell division protein ZapA [Deltaproteobacteria bacterium]
MNPNPGNPDPSAKGGPASGEPGLKKPAQASGAPLEVVTVKVFDRKCRFKSNRPELVQEIASLAEEEIALVKGQFPGLQHEMDLAAHVAFRLARRLNRCLREIGELNSSLDEAENRVKRMTTSIDLCLGE